MLRHTAVWSALLLTLALSALAQNTSPPELSTTSFTLWGHRSTSSTDELSGWLNTLEQDGDDNAMGPSASCRNVTAAGSVPMSENQAVNDALWGTPPINRTYNLTLAPGLAQPLSLDASRPIQATVFFGAGACAGHPRIDASLFSGAALIAFGGVNHTYAAGAPYANSTFNMTLQNTTLFAGQPLLLQIRVNGTYYGAGFLGVGDPQGRTRIDLPILGPIPSPTTSTTSTTSSSTTTTTSSSTTTTQSITTTTTPTPTPTSTSSSTTTSDNGGADEKSSPGAGLVVIAIGLLGTVLAVRRRLA